MKQLREEKTENIIKRKRRRQSSSLLKSTTSSLPLDIALEIFLKLPAKSVLRFRCVSKLWSSITTEPNFTNSFETRPRLLLLFFKEGDKLFVFSVPQHNQNPNESYSYSSSQPLDSYHMTYPKRCSFTIKMESVHGLICFQRSANPIVWNPTTRKFLPLPKPDNNWKDIKVFLGYDPIEGKHKVVCMPGHNSYDECRVLTLRGSDQELWRSVKYSHNHSPFSGKGVYGRCINGVLYYLAQLGSGHVMMSFHVRSEKFDVITLPWGKYWRRMMMMSYQGKLACVGSSVNNSISLWVLEDAEKHEWSTHIFLPLSHYDQGLQNFKLMGITDDGELIYLLNSAFKSVPVIYIDPKRQTFRRIEYRGIVDDDFRQRNGLGDRRLRSLQSFPNHFQTLLSL